MIKHRTLLIVRMGVRFLTGVFLFAIGTVNASASSNLVAHRALYALSLADDSNTDLFAGVNGTMVMSIEQTCDGWIFTQDFSAIYSPIEGADLKQTAFFTSWESNDGSQYRFVSRSGFGNELTVYRGRASVKSDGSGTAFYSEPEETELELPTGTLFPVAYHQWLMQSAAAGYRFVSRSLFNGMDDVEPKVVSAFIGKAFTPSAPQTTMENDLVRTAGWPVTLSYHDPARQSGTPLYEVKTIQLDNGIAAGMRVIWENLSTDLTLINLEPLVVPDCG